MSVVIVGGNERMICQYAAVTQAALQLLRTF